MKINRTQRLCFAALASAVLLSVPTKTKADLLYNVTINVSSLVGNSDGLFSLDLQLAEGSGNVSNSVSLSNFVFTGGSAIGSPDFTNGGESGSITAGVRLTNTSLDNEFAQEFSAGVTKIQFLVDETSNSEVVGSGTPIPDQFNVAVLDNNLNNILTTDPSGGSSLLSEAISSGQTLSSVKTFSSTGGDGGVTVSISGIPDVAPTGWLLAAALALCASLRGFWARSARLA